MAAKGSPAHGIDFDIDIDDGGGTARGVEGDCVDVSWPMAVAVAEAHGAGDAYEEYIAGLKGSRGSATFRMNDVATVGSWTVCGGALGATRTITYQPFGGSAGYPEIEAECIITEINPSSNLTSVTGFTISWVTTSTVTVTTVGA